ncbi:MAG: hypothetical protein ACTTKL_01635 [Treponema sp.]
MADFTKGLQTTSNDRRCRADGKGSFFTRKQHTVKRGNKAGGMKSGVQEPCVDSLNDAQAAAVLFYELTRWIKRRGGRASSRLNGGKRRRAADCAKGLQTTSNDKRCRADGKGTFFTRKQRAVKVRQQNRQ